VCKTRKLTAPFFCFMSEGNRNLSGVTHNCDPDAPTDAPIDGIETILSSVFPNFPSSTEQEEALDWLLEEDSGLESFPDELVTRFVLAVFYFATDGENWVDNEGWLSEGSVCDWAGFSCLNNERRELNLSTYVHPVKRGVLLAFLKGCLQVIIYFCVLEL
jgi:hypothetical protein